MDNRIEAFERGGIRKDHGAKLPPVNGAASPDHRVAKRSGEKRRRLPASRFKIVRDIVGVENFAPQLPERQRHGTLATGNSAGDGDNSFHGMQWEQQGNIRGGKNPAPNQPRLAGYFPDWTTGPSDALVLRVRPAGSTMRAVTKMRRLRFSLDS